MRAYHHGPLARASPHLLHSCKLVGWQRATDIYAHGVTILECCSVVAMVPLARDNECDYKIEVVGPTKVKAGTRVNVCNVYGAAYTAMYMYRYTSAGCREGDEVVHFQ